MEVPENDGMYGDWSERRACVVLGGRGFLGRSLVTRLLRLGYWVVKVADSQSLQLNPSSDSDSLLSSAVESAIKGASVVFFMEPSNLDINGFCNCYMIIVRGTRNVINACRECKVRRLLYNSSADVVFNGSQDIHNGDESLMCPWKDKLIDLKAQAERLIVFANNIDGLLTCALRPSNVFGPGDAQLVPLLVNLAKCGLAKEVVKICPDFTYAENVAHAYVCAAEALDSQVVSVAGKTIHKTSTKIAWYILLIVKWMQEKLHFRFCGYSVSAHYIVQLASHTRTFDCTASKRKIGYSLVVALDEGITSTVESSTHLAKDVSFVRYSDYDGQSKAEKLLGGGKILCAAAAHLHVIGCYPGTHLVSSSNTNRGAIYFVIVTDSHLALTPQCKL